MYEAFIFVLSVARNLQISRLRVLYEASIRSLIIEGGEFYGIR